ncbi:MAG TPA: hypothetical protein PKA53_07020 [Sphingobacterium sp.]|nr:hypothetical protein [Sphingobacterium sp.]
MKTMRLDRKSFKAQTAQEAADYAVYYKELSWKERLKVASYLNSIAYNYPSDNPPRMDKTKGTARVRK